MIARLTGKLTYKSPDYSIIDVSGVGYQAFTPFSTFYELPDTGAEVVLSIYTHVREDAIQLFGFLTAGEKEMFQLLIGVSGIGPKLGITILSGISTEELRSAISAGNLVRLTAIPGIGKKTAERMVLELKDKILKVHIPEEARTTGTIQPDEIMEDAVSALMSLGYKKPQAEDAVKKVRREQPETEMEGLIKGALKLLSKG